MFAVVQKGLADWNELRLLLAVARAGTLKGAAIALGVDHSTAFRRLQSLESRLNVPLFERLPGGAHVPTELGERLAASAERMEDEVLSAERDMAGRDASLRGRLRVTSSETLAYRLLTRLIARFRVAHPGMVLELAVDNRVLNLSRREADVALRVARPREGDLWGRKLADVAWTVYGAAALLPPASHAAGPSTVSAAPWIGWEEGASGIGAADWIAAHTEADMVVYRTNSVLNQLAAARAGIGLAALPCYLGDPEPGLRRALPDPVPELTRELWIVTHTDLRRTARVRAFFDIVAEGLERERPLIEGRGAATGP